MDNSVNILRLKRIDKMIERKQTGCPAEFARKLEISETTLYRYLRLIKKLGAPLSYDTYLQSYFYERTGNIKIHFYENDPVNSDIELTI